MTYFGVVARFDGCVFCCEQSCQGDPTPVPQFDATGRQIFSVSSGQFVIVAEGKPGLSGVSVARSLSPSYGDERPDIWIQSSRDLGNGSAKVCDTGTVAQGGGGVPGIDPSSFSFDDSRVTDALVDFACRFDSNVSISSPCTILDLSRDPRPVVATSTAQFCDLVAATSAFPVGDTTLSLTLRDLAGNTGPTAQIVVRVSTPTPTPPR